MVADLVVCRDSILFGLEEQDGIPDQDQSFGFPLHVEPREVEQGSLEILSSGLLVVNLLHDQTVLHQGLPVVRGLKRNFREYFTRPSL